MLSSMKLASLLTFAYIQLKAVESTSSFGKVFMVALPKMLPDKINLVTFYMVSMATAPEVTCTVLITSPHYKHGDELRVITQIHGNQIIKKVIDLIYISQVDLGRKNSLRLAGNASFTLTVVMEAKSTNASASLLAVPVQYWGLHYYAVTLNGNPSIQIISSMANNDVSITLRMTPVNFSLLYDGDKYQDGSSLLVKLDKWEAFVISKCFKDNTSLDEGNMTGTFISGTYKIGVVSGNCLTAGVTGRCYAEPTIQVGQKLDIVAEMMLPVESHGTEFVIIVMLRQIQGYFYTIAEADQTSISVHNRYNKTETYVHAAGTVKLLAVTTCTVGDCEALKVTATRPICVVYISPSSCFLNDLHTAFEKHGSSGMVVIIPTTLFYWKYYFSQFARSNEHIVVVIKVDGMSSLFVDGVHYRQHRRTVYPISMVDDWKVIEIQTTKRETLHIITTRIFSNFGCYAYDSVRNGALISPVGFHRCEYLTRNNPTPDDGIDNDCDGQIDEETQNEMDDDNDNLVDEDFKSGKLIDFMAPTVNPMACPPFHWGVFCRSCQACINDCDRVTGICQGCKPGYKNKRYGCDEDHSKIVFLLLLIIPLALLIWVGSERCKIKNPMDIGEAMDTYFQESSTVTGHNLGQ